MAIRESRGKEKMRFGVKVRKDYLEHIKAYKLSLEGVMSEIMLGTQDWIFEDIETENTSGFKKPVVAETSIFFDRTEGLIYEKRVQSFKKYLEKKHGIEPRNQDIFEVLGRAVRGRRVYERVSTPSAGLSSTQKTCERLASTIGSVHRQSV